jgi:DNA polymerase-1
MKLAMIKVHDLLNSERMKSYAILQVHDELVFEAPQEELFRLKEIVEEGMSRAVILDIPLDIEISTGDYWC